MQELRLGRGAEMSKIKNFFLRLLVALIALAMIGVLSAMLINNHVKGQAEDKILYMMPHDIEINSIAKEELVAFDADCAIVLGCGIKDKNTPTPMLKDRLDAGIALYNEGVVPKLLLTGDNGQVGHNEIHVMLKYTKEAGVPEKDIFCDHAGFSTYDSMYRAIDVFKAEKAIVVTQKYHEYRALYIANKLGLEAVGVASDQQSYFGQTYRELREILARDKDFFKANLRSKAIYSGEAIPISGSGLSSHGE